MERQFFQDSNTQEERDILLIFLMKEFIKNHSLENLSEDILNTLEKNKIIKSKNISSEKLDNVRNDPKNISSQELLNKSRFLRDFTIIDKIGRGGFGSVFKVRNNLDCKFYAIKIVNVNSDNKDFVLEKLLIYQI